MAKSKTALPTEDVEAVKVFLASRPNQLTRRKTIAERNGISVVRLNRIIVDNSMGWPICEDRDGGSVCLAWVGDWDEPLRFST